MPPLHPFLARFLFIIFSLSSTSLLWSQTEVSGLVSGDWTISNSPYLITSDAIIAETDTLRIGPGVTVMFKDADDDLVVQGTLIAAGTPGSQIRFTSDESTPAPGQWGQITFNDSSNDTATQMSHCIVEFGGGFRNQQIEIVSSSPTLRNLTVRSGRTNGIGIVSGNPTLTDIAFIQNANHAMTVDVHSFPSLSGSNAERNGGDTIARHGGTLSGSGTWVRDALPYTILNDIVIPAEHALTIEQGTVIQFQDTDDDLFVDGTLTAIGTMSAPIRFTSNEEILAPGQWGALILRNSEDTSKTELKHCIVEAGGGFRNEQIDVTKAAPTLSNLLIRLGRVHGIKITEGNPIVDSCTFEDNNQYAVVTDVFSYPQFFNSKANRNGHDAIGRSGGTAITSGTWVRDDIPYTIINDLFIKKGVTLSIESGTTIQFQDVDDDLVFDGRLEAMATESSPIMFTSNKKEKAQGQWGAVIIRNQEDSDASIVDGCVFEFGGGFRNEMLLIDRASPVINHSVFRSGRVHGITLTAASPSISSSQFTENNQFAMSMNVHSFPLLNDNTANENGSNSFGIKGGTVIANGSWIATSVPFTIVNDIFIAETAEVTLTPGSIIQFADTDDDLTVDGALIARGTAEAPIRFTSDTLEKAAGQWGSIVVRGTANDSRTVFEHCILEYGGGFRNETLRLENTSPQIRNSQINHSRVRGLSLINSEAQITQSIFNHNNDYAIVIDTKSFPTLSVIAANDNGANAIGILGGTIEGRNTWHRSPIPYTIINDVTVTPDATLSIESGTLLQFQDADDDLVVNGTLVANGTATLPIHFSSDNVEKAPGQWGAVRFRDPSNDQESSLTFVHLEYGGGFRNGSLELDSASPPLISVQIQFSRADGLHSTSSRSVIQNSTFSENARDGIRARSGSTLKISESTIEGNQGFGINNQDTDVIIEATNNYWGDRSGPLDTKDDDNLEQTNPDGLGDAVSEFVRWRPFLESPATQPATLTPVIDISPSPVVFGEVTIEQTAAQLVRITNRGPGALTIGSINSNTPRFRPQDLRNPSLAEGEFVDIRIIFNPTAIGPIEGILSVESNDPNTPIASIPLSGTGLETTLPTEPVTGGIATRITFDPNDELTPAWHPTGQQIAFATNRNPGEFNDIGLVNADGTEERLAISGPQSPFGIASFGLSWAEDHLLTTESVVFHEYMSIDLTQAPFERTMSDGNDSAFTRRLLIDGGAGGELFRASRDGSTALWRFSTQGGIGQVSLRSAPFNDLTGQSARSLGRVHFETTIQSGESRQIRGADLDADGSHFVVSLKSGNGFDLYLHATNQDADPVRLTTTGESSGSYHTNPVFSPDSQSIAFVYWSGISGDQSDLHIYHLESRTTSAVTTTTSLGENWPSWSPDGNQLVFSRFDSLESGTLLNDEPENWNLYTLDLEPTPTNPTDPTDPPLPIPAIQLSAESIDFGSIELGNTQSRTVTVSNTGEASLIITSVNVSPPFESTHSGLPNTLGPGQSTEFNIIFTPTAFGMTTGNLTFDSSDPTTPQATVHLSGTGIELLVPSPTIESIEPNIGRPGTQVTIKGRFFAVPSTDNIILVAGQAVPSIQSNSSEELRFLIPENIRTGTVPIQVDVDQRLSNIHLFTIEAPVVVQQPELTIEKMPDDFVAISWFDPLEQFTLQSKRTLDSESNWSNWPNDIILENDFRRTQTIPSEPQQFFRLIALASPSEGGTTTTSSLPVSNLPLDWQPDYPILANAEGNITPANGLRLTMPDGGTISVPANSVTEEAEFRITELDFRAFSQGSRRVFQVDTTATSFLHPVRLNLPAPSKMAGETDEFVVYRNTPEAPIVELPHTYDATSNLISFESDQFSTLIIERKGVTADTIHSQHILDVPFYPQGDSYWCWAASSQMMFKYYGKDIEAWEVARYFEMPPDDGPTLLRLGIGSYDRLFESFGLEIDDISAWVSLDHFRTYLIKQIDRGHPLMVLVQNAIHAIVVVGYDASGVYLHDPSGFSILNAKGVNTAAELFPNLGRSYFTWEQFKTALFGRKKLGIEFNVYLPVWALRIKNEPAPPPIPVTMTILGVNQTDFFLNRPIHGTANTSDFVWNGEFPDGYQFAPKRKFSPPDHPVNDDEMALKLTLNNTSAASRAVDIEVKLNGQTMIQTPSPITIPAMTTRHTLDLVPFTQAVPFQAPSRPLRAGKQKMWISLKSDGVLLDWIPIDIETGPSVPQNLKAESDPNGVRLTWDPIPEAFTSDIEYEIFQGILDRGRNNVSSFIVRGGATSTAYRVRARDLSTGRAGPFTDPVTSETKAKAYQLSEGPTIEDGEHISDTQATARSGPNLQTVTWTAPPAQLDPGEEFTIELTGTSSGPASFKYAPSGPFGSFSTPRGLSPGWISASAIVNPTGATRNGFADGSARAGYFRVSVEDCPPDPQTRQFCYEPLAESFTQTLKAPVDRQEFWIVVRLGGFDSETSLLGGLVSWKYTNTN